MILLVIESTSSILRVNVVSQSKFSVLVKGQTEILGRQMDTDRDTYNTFTDFTGRNKLAQM